MTDFTTTSCGEFSKAYMPLDLFYLVKDFDEMGALLDGPAGDMMKEQFTADTNLKNLTYGILGPRNMTNSKHAITGVADMSGLKMRVQSNQLHMMGMKALEPVRQMLHSLNCSLPCSRALWMVRKTRLIPFCSTVITRCRTI